MPSASLSLGRQACSTHWIGGWLGSRGGLDLFVETENFVPAANRTPVPQLFKSHCSNCTDYPTPAPSHIIFTNNFLKIFRYSVTELYTRNSWFNFRVKHFFDWNCSSMVFWWISSWTEQRNMTASLSLVNLIDVAGRGSVSLGTTSECQRTNWIRPRKCAIAEDFQ